MLLRLESRLQKRSAIVERKIASKTSSPQASDSCPNPSGSGYSGDVSSGDESRNVSDQSNSTADNKRSIHHQPNSMPASMASAAVTADRSRGSRPVASPAADTAAQHATADPAPEKLNASAHMHAAAPQPASGYTALPSNHNGRPRTGGDSSHLGSNSAPAALLSSDRRAAPRAALSHPPRSETQSATVGEQAVNTPPSEMEDSSSDIVHQGTTATLPAKLTSEKVGPQQPAAAAASTPASALPSSHIAERPASDTSPQQRAVHPSGQVPGSRSLPQAKRGLAAAAAAATISNTASMDVDDSETSSETEVVRPSAHRATHTSGHRHDDSGNDSPRHDQPANSVSPQHRHNSGTRSMVSQIVLPGSAPAPTNTARRSQHHSQHQHRHSADSDPGPQHPLAAPATITATSLTASLQEPEGPGGPPPVRPASSCPRKGKLEEWEKQRVDAMVTKVKQGSMPVARGDLARALQLYVNPYRQRDFYEKLVSRRRLNAVLSPFLGPKVKRARKRKHTSGNASAGATESDTPSANGADSVGALPHRLTDPVGWAGPAAVPSPGTGITTPAMTDRLMPPNPSGRGVHGWTPYMQVPTGIFAQADGGLGATSNAAAAELFRRAGLGQQVQAMSGMPGASLDVSPSFPVSVSSISSHHPSKRQAFDGCLQLPVSVGIVSGTATTTTGANNPTISRDILAQQHDQLLRLAAAQARLQQRSSNADPYYAYGPRAGHCLEDADVPSHLGVDRPMPMRRHLRYPVQHAADTGEPIAFQPHSSMQYPPVPVTLTSTYAVPAGYLPHAFGPFDMACNQPFPQRTGHQAYSAVTSSHALHAAASEARAAPAVRASAPLAHGMGSNNTISVSTASTTPAPVHKADGMTGIASLIKAASVPAVAAQD